MTAGGRVADVTRRQWHITRRMSASRNPLGMLDSRRSSTPTLLFMLISALVGSFPRGLRSE